jgi:hypothetical protein
MMKRTKVCHADPAFKEREIQKRSYARFYYPVIVSTALDSGIVPSPPKY